jgi:hypothetical protein
MASACPLLLLLTLAQSPLPATTARPEVKVAVEVQLLSVAEDVLLEQWRLASQASGAEDPDVAAALQGLLNSPVDTAATSACLNARQCHRFLEAVQADVRSRTTHLPELTVASGQEVTMRLPASHPGFYEGVGLEPASCVPFADAPESRRRRPEVTLTLRPLASADGHEVCLEFRMTRSVPGRDREVAGFVARAAGGAADGGQPRPTSRPPQPACQIVRIERTLQIPEGHSVVTPVWARVRQLAAEDDGPPVLADIPYLGQLFKTAHIYTARDRVFILVTAHVVTGDE